MFAFPDTTTNVAQQRLHRGTKELVKIWSGPALAKG